MNVVGDEDLCPKLGLATLDEVSRLLLEHGVLVRDSNEFIVAEALRVRDVREVRIASLTELADDKGLVELTCVQYECTAPYHIATMRKPHVVLLEELLRVVVAVNVDLGESIEYS